MHIGPAFTIMLAVTCLAACASQQPTTPTERQPLAADATRQQLTALTGVVIRESWTKSYESWNAGGSEYYVLKVDHADLPAENWSAREGVILRPSAAIPFDRFSEFVGKTVTCQGEFVAGEPYVEPDDNYEQTLYLAPSPITREINAPARGSGFKVYLIKTTARQ